LQPGDCVFDVGANIGLFTLWVYERCGVARVFAFEPLPQTFAQLERNVRAYSLPVELYQCGLGAAAGEWQFTYYPKATAMSGRYAEAGEDERLARALLKNQDAALNEYANELMAQRFASEQVRCEVTTISAVLAQHGVEQIDLLKVDVEKSELDVLAGIAAHDWPRIKQVVVEVHDKQGRLAAIRELLERQGFAVAVQQDELLGGTELYNVYAVHPSRDERRPQSSETTDWRPSSVVTVEQKLRRHLQRYLPAYMLPSQIVVLDQLPLLPSGKLNRQALPDPASLTATERAYTAPRTEIEEVLATIWSELLGRDRLGVHDNFFHSGGHSLLATQLVSRVRETFQLDVPLTVVFEAPTIAEFAKALISREPKPGQIEKIAQLVKKIQALSDAEVTTLLTRN
jgi:FkbM family methyltransferase